VLPAVDIQCHYTVGKYRLPLLRGPVDPDLDLYSRFENSYTNDLDRWLCNVYVEIRLESKELLTGNNTLLSNQEIVMDYTAQLLQVRRGEWLNREDEEGEGEGREGSEGREGREGKGNMATAQRDSNREIDSEYVSPGALSSGTKHSSSTVPQATDASFGGYQAPSSKKQKKGKNFAMKDGLDATHRESSLYLTVVPCCPMLSHARSRETD
jgi:hypothetical protein